MNKLPSPIQRVYYYRRHGRDAYVAWLLGEVGLEGQDVPYDARYEIDDYIQNVMKPEPSWVEAAKEAVSKTPEEVDAEYEEKWEEAKDALSPSEEEEEEEVIEVASQDNPFSDTEVDYNSWTVVELRADCKERGLPVYGTKAEIVMRLRRDDESVTQPEQDETKAPSEEAVEESSDAPSEEAATEEVNENAADSEQGNDIEEEE
jgi:hypothetical protein